jgi:lysophospholipase L1-like esterase
VIKVTFTDEIEIITSTEHLYQWDVGQVLEIGGLTNIGTPMVHFGVKGDTTGYAVQSQIVNDKLRCGIPDIVLQSGKQITAYVYVLAGASKYTDRVILIPVVERNKPNNYATVNMADVTETQSFFDDVVDRIELLETRMNTFSALPEGTTTSDAEIIDARIGADGKTYSNLGEAIRTQVNNSKSDLINAKNSIIGGNYKDIKWFDGISFSKTTNGELISNNGTQTATTTELLPVTKGAKIIVSADFIARFGAYDENKNFISDSYISEKPDYIEYTPTENGYIRVSIFYKDVVENGVTVFSAVNKEDVSITCNIEPINIENYWYGKSFVSLGDSITWQDGKEYTQGNYIGKIARGYQTIIKEKLGFISYNNMGISGRPIANGTTNGDGTVTTAQSINYTGFDLCIIAGGTNDFKLNVPLGEIGVIGDTEFDNTTFYGAYREMIEYILTQKPTIRICLFTPLQRNTSSYDVNSLNTVGHKLIDYVNAIKLVGEMYGIPVCDMYANSGFTKLTLDTYTMDGLHPNDIGYERMGGYASQYINAIGN